MGDFVPPGTDSSKLFGYTLTGRYLPFAVCTGGIFLCYCLSSVSQEYVYAVGFNYTSFLTLWCKLLAVGWGVAGGGLRERRAPHSWHAAVGFLTFATMWLSNQSLLWLNYPTQTVFKSAKLIPVMLGAVLINRKRFHPLEYLSALALLAGLVAFTLTDAKVSPSFDLVGVFVICLALVADALIGNVQERMFHSYNTGASEMMTYSSAWAALLSLIMCVLEGETIAAVHFVLTDRLALLCISVYALLNIIGIYFVLVMIAHFGATLTTFTTSLRKGLSVVLSFLVYTKPFAWGYVLGGLLTALGIALNMQASAAKRREKGNKGGSAIAAVAAASATAAAAAAAADGKRLGTLELRPLIGASPDGSVEDGAPLAPSSAHAMGSPALPTTPLHDSAALLHKSSALHSALDVVEVGSAGGAEDVEAPASSPRSSAAPSNSPTSISASLKAPRHTPGAAVASTSSAALRKSPSTNEMP